MRTTLLNILVVAVFSTFVGGCATVSSSPVASEVTASSYEKSRSTKGVVVLGVNWGRQWGCSGFDIAEIMSFGFDRLPIKSDLENNPPEVFLDGPLSLTKKRAFYEYALLLEPGEYALSSFDIKAARSVSDVGHFVAKRSDLIKENKPQGGSFQIGAGEIIYIGHFFLDCYQVPTLWRYYKDGREAFKEYKDQIKRIYPFLEVEKMKYRLFRTTTLGREYELPNDP